MNRILFSINNIDLKYIIKDDYIEKCAVRKKQYSFFTRKKIVKYLKTNQLFDICDLTECIICKQLAQHYETWYTDEEWVWSGDIIHYIKKHNLTLPDEFLSSIKNNKFKNGKISKAKLEKLEANQQVLEIARKHHPIDFDAPPYPQANEN
jgi:hypothetical protein